MGGVIMLGPEAIRAVQKLLEFATGAVGAQSDADLDQAGEHLATAVAIVGVDGATGLLAHRVGGVLGDNIPRIRTGGSELVTPESVPMRLGSTREAEFADPLAGSGHATSPSALLAPEPVGSVSADPLSLRTEVAAAADAGLQPMDAVDAGKILANDRMGHFAANVQPKPGYYDVAIHGAPDEFLIKSDSFTGAIDHRTLAGIISSDPQYPGGPVRLLSCSSGALDEGVAQNLANKLGVEVIAPSDTLWIYADGRLVIGPNALTNSGAWRPFYPGGH